MVIEEGTPVYRDHLTTRNKEVPELMRDRRVYRQASRRGERLARKRLAKKHGTLSTKLPTEGKHIAGCKKPVQVKDINNTEVRFSNRKRHGYSNVPDASWITPTANHLVLTTLNHVDQVRKLLPVTDWCLEINKFAFMKMEDGTVIGTDFQNGRMKGYSSVDEYVFARQEGRCACCGKPIGDNHHIIPVSEGGSDGPENRVGLCEDCHGKYHVGELEIDLEGCLKKYGALSVLNQAIPFILKGLIDRFGEEHVHTCSGYETHLARTAMGLSKSHDNDALAIVRASTGISVKNKSIHCFELAQFRRHNRANIKSQRERTYYVKDPTARGGKRAVAKNRRPRFEQSKNGYPALSQYVEKGGDVSSLIVTKSVRRHNSKNREWFPGDRFEYLGREYVVSGQQNRGMYLLAY